MSNYLMLFIFFFASNNMCTAAKNTLSFGQRCFLEKKGQNKFINEESIPRRSLFGQSK